MRDLLQSLFIPVIDVELAEVVLIDIMLFGKLFWLPVGLTHSFVDLLVCTLQVSLSGWLLRFPLSEPVM